jgi:predicted enzyme related to lactoylglutathione lyase
MAEAITTASTGTFVWNEIGTGDVEACKAFYSSLFDWTTREMDMGSGGTYTIFQSGGRDVGGLYRMKAQQQQMGVAPHWLAYIGVEDVDASAHKAESMGGRVLVPPTDIPNTGRFAVLSDPTGATFAIYKGAQS